MSYILKQYDYDLAHFDIYYDIEGFRVENFNIVENNRHLLPLNLKLNNEGMAKWLKNRSIPKNREFVDKFLSKIGLNHNNTKGIIDICKGLSLNDSYWVVDDTFKKTFKECNLYENRFNNILALIAFTGYGSSIKAPFMSSPELTTNGMLAKCWRRVDGNIYLYKAGTSGFVNSGKEPYSEYYASQIAEVMGVNHVDYNIKKWKEKLCSTCEIFTDIDHSYMPIGHIVEQGGLKSVLEYVKGLGDDYYNQLIDMIVYDAIIVNTDRHYGNFGFIVNNKTNKIESFAPLFDHGASLFAYAMDNDEFSSIDTLTEYSKTRTAVMYSNFIQTAKELMNKNQIEKVRKLINFKFKKHSKYNLPDKRLKLIEKFIQIRIQELLK
ncbi:MAG: XRE family transcriptional regulator [Bacilli bacterium]|nr:XRE family transcriptional regulator [Bacilli bacterium]